MTHPPYDGNAARRFYEATRPVGFVLSLKEEEVVFLIDRPWAGRWLMSRRQVRLRDNLTRKGILESSREGTTLTEFGSSLRQMLIKSRASIYSGREAG